MSRTILLHCPDCRRALRGADSSRVFICTTCMRGFEVPGDMTGGFPVQPVAALSPRNWRAVYFPFWRLNVSWKQTPGQQATTSGQPFFVAARMIRRLEYFGDIGMQLTRNGYQPAFEPLRDYPVFPIDRGLEQAARYPVVYRMKERGSGEKAAESLRGFSVRSADLLLVPFYFRDNEYTDGLLSWNYPASAVH